MFVYLRLDQLTFAGYLSHMLAIEGAPADKDTHIDHLSPMFI